ncbi:hypothetical protein AJ80_05865 [Polytolypa hystricis UAMH7299]|uniref:MAPEG family protein n=1 Tax=Polytolypa hystricis (strain UAMH7299) TaxID=1447883 RepID=A0A2B7Y020_POLH7|nr:hypothetical protein AJ80_05865 [Polytolypa hystricis UAMH7299]
MQSTNNWSIHSIAGAYALALAPHGYYYVKMMASAKGNASNLLPRENLNNLKAHISSEVWNKLSRARGAHLNALEGLPLFAAAMLVGNIAKLPSSDLNLIAAEYLGARVLYTALYMGARSEFMSYIRTGVWAWSIALPIWGLIKAGRVFQGE